MATESSRNLETCQKPHLTATQPIEMTQKNAYIWTLLSLYHGNEILYIPLMVYCCSLRIL